jgi:hypothetical protein
MIFTASPIKGGVTESSYVAICREDMIRKLELGLRRIADDQNRDVGRHKFNVVFAYQNVGF